MLCWGEAVPRRSVRRVPQTRNTPLVAAGRGIMGAAVRVPRGSRPPQYCNTIDRWSANASDNHSKRTDEVTVAN
jgi:hypothetical protein